MSSIINNLFPENSFEASMKLINTKKSIENSIPKYLEQYGFVKLKTTKGLEDRVRSEKGNTYFINFMRNIFLCYRKKDFTNTEKSKEKKQKVISDLCELIKNNPNYQLIYGYLIGTTELGIDIVSNNNIITVLSGEYMLRHLLQESYDLVIENMKSKVNELFE